MADPGHRPSRRSDLRTVADRPYGAERTTRLAGEAFSLITGLNLRCSISNESLLKTSSPDRTMIPTIQTLTWIRTTGCHGLIRSRSRRGGPRTATVSSQALATSWAHQSRASTALDVLRSGYQRQRILAAHYLCLLQPGTPLFRTPARRPGASSGCSRRWRSHGREVHPRRVVRRLSGARGQPLGSRRGSVGLRRLRTPFARSCTRTGYFGVCGPRPEERGTIA